MFLITTVHSHKLEPINVRSWRKLPHNQSDWPNTTVYNNDQSNTTAPVSSEIQYLQEAVDKLTIIVQSQQTVINSLTDKLKFVLAFLDIILLILITALSVHELLFLLPVRSVIRVHQTWQAMLELQYYTQCLRSLLHLGNPTKWIMVL